MPTGYTEAIKDGIKFEEFVWECARAFGALVLMRDEPSGAPIPEFKPTTHHTTELQRATADLKRFQTMSLKQAEKLSLKAYEDTYKMIERWNCDNAALKTKYKAMLEQVQAWTPPSSGHVGLKEFMAEQIQQSIMHDCSIGELPEPKQAKEWLRLEIEKAKRDIDYHTKKNAEEVKRANSRNEWVKTLAGSVPIPTKLKLATV